MSNSRLLNLSQSHLNLLSLCPPKFQQVYLDRLGSLPDPKQQEGMEWGSRFHLLMQQRELNLPIEPFLAHDLELNASIKDLIGVVPELVNSDSSIWREAEHYRTLGYDNFVLTVIYDLLVAQDDKATILDWKTYRKPAPRKKLASNWQTRLYMYVLAETSEYTPEQIQMTYWFVKSGKPTNETFNYSQTLHQHTEQDLNALLSQLEVWLQNYQHHEVNLPHKSNCQDCPYHESLCVEDNLEIEHQELINAIAEIEEISI